MSSNAHNGIEVSYETPARERRLLYNDGSSEGAPKNEPMDRPQRTPRRRSSTFNTMTILFLSAVVIILYISNIITVNRLVVEVNEVQQKYDAVVNSNEILRAEINRRASLERIGKMATEQLGLRYAKEQPTFLELDAKLTKEAEKSK